MITDSKLRAHTAIPTSFCFHHQQMAVTIYHKSVSIGVTSTVVTRVGSVALRRIQPLYTALGISLSSMTCSHMFTYTLAVYITSSPKHSALLQDRPAADWFSECSLQHHWSPDRHCELLLPPPQVWSSLLLGLRHSCPIHWDGHEPQVKVSSNWHVWTEKSFNLAMVTPVARTWAECNHIIQTLQFSQFYTFIFVLLRREILN